MKIIAFSDWEVQDIELIIDYLEELQKKPDVIIYAGDDIERFNWLPYKFLPNKVKKREREWLREEAVSFENLDAKALDKILQCRDLEYNKDINYFEKIATFSKYGLCVIAGNDDPPYMKQAIKGKKVYNVHNNPFLIDNYAIIGNEGALGDLGCLLYTEQDMKDHLEKTINQIDDKQIILVSHTPPYGILDLAIRYGKSHIGSVSLKNFIENYTDKIKLVISGHVHRQGERSEKYHKTSIVNCASNDDYKSPGLIAVINLLKTSKIDIGWKKLYGLTMVPYIGLKRAEILRKNGIKQIKQLAALEFNHKIFKKIGQSYIIKKYVNAIISNKILFNQEGKLIIDKIEKKNIYFFDAEYDPVGTSSGPYGMFLLGYMNRDGNIIQLFLDNPKEELELLQKFNQWILKEKPYFIAYCSRTADVPQLRNCYHRLKLNFDILEDLFFDLYSDLLYTGSRDRQKIFLPVTGSIGLKNVSETLGYPKPNLEISEGIMAPVEYMKYVMTKKKAEKEKIKDALLSYNRDDLKRAKYIYDQLKLTIY